MAQATQKPEIITFRNKNFIKRNYDCTNVVFCQINNNIVPEKLPDHNWTVCKTEEINQRECTQLYIIDGIRYFGYL